MRERDKIPCPVCGKRTVGEYDICENCFWENDPIQLAHPDLGGGANRMSPYEARDAYQGGKPVR